MREVAAVSANFVLVENSVNELSGAVELIFILTEPHYHFDGSGTLVRERRVSQERFSLTAASLRDTVRTMQKLEKALTDFTEKHASKSPEAA